VSNQVGPDFSEPVIGVVHTERSVDDSDNSKEGVKDISCKDALWTHQSIKSGESTSCCCEAHRQQLQELLEEWGERHRQKLLLALQDSMHSVMIKNLASNKEPSLEGDPPLPFSRFSVTPGPAVEAARSKSSEENVCGIASTRGSLRNPITLAPWGKNNVIEAIVGDTLNASTRSVSVNRSTGRLSVFSKTAQCVAASQTFGAFNAMIILANAAFLGWQADIAMKSSSTDAASWAQTLDFIEAVFTFYFLFEVLMRYLAMGYREFFCGPELGWNIFDVFLVLHGLLVRMADVIQNASFLRVVRLVRMMKLLRLIRLLHGFRELRFIINSILGSVRSTVWACMLVVVITYTFGLVFLQASARYVREEGVSEKDMALVRKYWGSIPLCMLSLLMAGTGGEDWAYIGEPLYFLGWPYFLLFVFYIVSFLFVVVNTITGLFVEATLKHSNNDDSMVIQQELDKRHKYVERLRAAFYKLDTDEDGLVSIDEFTEALASKQMQAFLASLSIDGTDAEAFFRVLTDHLPDKRVDLETFVVGCIKLRGEAKAMDVFLLLSQQTSLQKQVKRIERLLERPSSKKGSQRSRQIRTNGDVAYSEEKPGFDALKEVDELNLQL